MHGLSDGRLVLLGVKESVRQTYSLLHSQPNLKRHRQNKKERNISLIDDDLFLVFL